MSDSTSTSSDSREAAAQAFARVMQDRMEPHRVEAGVQAIRSAGGGGIPASYTDDPNPAVAVSGGQVFSGNGNGYYNNLQGSLSTSDTNALYGNTTQYWWSSQNGTLYVWFFDQGGDTLGTFTAGGATIEDYNGSGGTGSWS